MNLRKVRTDAWGAELADDERWDIYRLTRPPREGEEDRPVVRTFEDACRALEARGITPPSRAGWFRFLARMRQEDRLQMIYAVSVDKARDSRVRAVRIDSTGIGAMLAEEAAKKLGGKCQGVVFNVASKGEMYGLMRRRFEERSVRIPVERELREDLHAVQRVVSTGGNVTYSAPRNADGHSDRAAALALCIYGAHEGGEYVKPFGSGRRRNYDMRTI